MGGPPRHGPPRPRPLRGRPPPPRSPPRRPPRGRSLRPGVLGPGRLRRRSLGPCLLRPGRLRRRRAGHRLLGLGGGAVAAPERVRRLGHFVIGAAALDRVRKVLRVPSRVGRVVLLVKQQPLLLAARL